MPGGSGSKAYTAALKDLDGDMPQYIHDNTEDEISHFTFINAYLMAKGADPVNLDRFRTLPSSKATGAQQIGRLTNLMQLTVDTSWWTRYRSRTMNPDLGDTTFAQAIPDLSKGQFPAIPRDDKDLVPANHIRDYSGGPGVEFDPKPLEIRPCARSAVQPRHPTTRNVGELLAFPTLAIRHGTAGRSRNPPWSRLAVDVSRNTARRLDYGSA